MAVTYKDIDQLSQKSSVAGTEKLPVSDTQYITPSQIAGLVSVSGKADKVSSATNGDFAGLDSNGNLTDSGKKASDFQEALVSGTNIKTINGISLLGSGNIDAKDILVVDYDSNQAWQDIVAAYSNGKAVYCKVDESPDVYLIPLTYLDTSDSAVFISPIQANGYFIWAAVNMSNSWDQGSFTLQPTLVSGTNIKTVNNESILGSGNISVGGGGDTSSCVHKTGDETVGGDKTFTDNIGVVDADHIVYSGGGGGGFTKSSAIGAGGQATLQFSVLGEPKAFVVTAVDYNAGALAIIGDSTGCRGIYAAASTYQHNYSTGFSASYSNGTLTITPPSGVSFIEEDYVIVYYYGDGSLTFKTSTVQPGSGVTAVTFTGTGLTEIPAMYACLLETQVNSEQYRRVALYTNSSWWTDYKSLGLTFFSQQVADTTSSFSVSYNNGLYINSGGMNAGGYFHNPGTYVLYYLMASDVAGGGGGGFQSLGDELDDIRDTISGIETLLAAI